MPRVWSLKSNHEELLKNIVSIFQISQNHKIFDFIINFFIIFYLFFYLVDNQKPKILVEELKNLEIQE